MFDAIDVLELAGVSGGQQVEPIQPQLPVPWPNPKGPNPGPCFPRPPLSEGPSSPRPPLPLPIDPRPDPIR